MNFYHKPNMVCDLAILGDNGWHKHSEMQVLRQAGDSIDIAKHWYAS